jgi:hypothetical protein
MIGIRKTALMAAILCTAALAQASLAQEQATPTATPPAAGETPPAQGAATAPAPTSPAAAPSTPPTAAPTDHMHETTATQGPTTRTPSRPGALLYIGWPQDGTVIHATRFKIWFGLRNFGVAPAGVKYPNTGHHHLIIDAPLPPFDEPIPNDKNHLHFGLGQTEAFVELPPGTHTLQLLLGDADHVPHDPPIYSQKITVYVRP